MFEIFHNEAKKSYEELRIEMLLTSDKTVCLSLTKLIAY